MNAQGDVLVVDDDPDLVEVMQVMLEITGYESRGARNGLEAIEAVAQKRPALILLDMRMPIMDGWQCARALRALYGRDLPIVVITAAEHARAWTDELGGIDDVLAKPFEMDALLDVVARYAEKRRAFDIRSS